MWYSYTNSPGNLMAVPVENVDKVLKMNKNNQIPDNLEDFAISLENKMEDDRVVGKDDISKLAD